MTETQVYWWLMLDNIKILCFMGGFLGAFCSAFLAFCENDFEGIAQRIRLCLGVFLLLICLIAGISGTLVPTSKQYAIIKIFPKMANSQLAVDVQKDIPEMYQMAKDALKDIIKPKEAIK